MELYSSLAERVPHLAEALEAMQVGFGVQILSVIVACEHCFCCLQSCGA